MSGFVEFAAGIREIQERGQGVLRVHIVRREGIDGIMRLAANGNPHAKRIARACSDVLKAMGSSPAGRRRCPHCSGAIGHRPFAICLLIPDVDDPDLAASFAICRECDGDQRALNERVGAVLSAVMPNVRVLPATSFHSGVGHA